MKEDEQIEQEDVGMGIKWEGNMIPVKAVSPGITDLFADKDFQVKVWEIMEFRPSVQVKVPEGHVLQLSLMDPFAEYSRSPANRLTSFPDKVPLNPFKHVMLMGKTQYFPSDEFQQLELDMTRASGFTSQREILEYKKGDRIARLVLMPISPLSFVPPINEGENSHED